LLFVQGWVVGLKPLQSKYFAYLCEKTLSRYSNQQFFNTWEMVKNHDLHDFQ